MKHDPSEIVLRQTCSACPEQYNAYLFRDHRQVGYLRLRYGVFTVQYGNALGPILLEAATEGHGEFSDGERGPFLQRARKALAEHLTNSGEGR